LVGALVAGLGALQVALADDVLTKVEIINVASVTLAALGLVWGVPNSSDDTVVPAAALEPAVEDYVADAEPSDSGEG